MESQEKKVKRYGQFNKSYNSTKEHGFGSGRIQTTLCKETNHQT